MFRPGTGYRSVHDRMQISISTTFNYDIPLRKQLPMIRKAGFTHISLGGGRLEHSGYLDTNGQKKLTEMLETSDLKICSIHAPLIKGVDISSPDEEVSSAALDLLKRTVDAALILRAKTVIFHPTSSETGNLDYRKEALVGQVLALLEHIGEEDVKLAVENLTRVPANEILTYSLERIDNPGYGLCYDSSHDNLTPEPMTILEKFGRRLVTTHISDNLAENDDHMLPFEGSFQWDRFCELFSQIQFEGIFLLEVEIRKSAFKPPQEFLNEAFSRARRLLEKSGMLP